VLSQMLAGIVTPYFRRLASDSGYGAAVPATASAPVLYRRMSAALRRRRPRCDRTPRIWLALRPNAVRLAAAEIAEFRKAKPH
jgi:hypothetical protein